LVIEVNLESGVIDYTSPYMVTNDRHRILGRMAEKGVVMKRIALVLMVCFLASSALAVTVGKDLYLPSVGHQQGSCPGGICAQWRTTAWIFNPSASTTANVTVYFLVRANSNAAPQASSVIQVPPGQAKELPDTVLTLFSQSNYGALRFVSDNSVEVTGRIYDANVTVGANPTGTAGQNFSGLSSDQAIGQTQYTDIIGLAQDAAGSTGTWRSNFGFVETTGNSVTVEVKRLDGTGAVLATKTYTLGARGSFQVSVEDVGGAVGTDQRLRLTVTGGTGKILVFGSVIDNRTGDPSTVEMVTAAAAAVKTTGRFEGVVLAGDGTSINGGLRLDIGASALSDFAVLSGVPCPDDANGVLIDVSGTNVTIGSTGSFTTSTTVPYSDGTQTVFTTTWTISGALQSDGTVTGTIRTDTSGGVNTSSFDYTKCNATNVVRNWRAGWTGN
jgi:hypothetical protein